MKIIWSKKAEKGFDNIVKYLEDGWSEDKAAAFVRDSYAFFELLKENPEMFETAGQRNLRRGPMNRLTILTYRVKPRKKEIYLVNIRGARQKPL